MRKSLLKMVPAAVTGLVVLAGLQVLGVPATPVPAPAVDLSDIMLAANNPSLNIFVEFQSPQGGTPPITGDSTNQARAGRVEATGVHFSGENPATLGSASGGAGTGKFKFNELTITKGLDKATTPLFIASATGGHYSKVIIYFDKTGPTAGQLAFRITLGVAFVKNVDISAGPEYSETVNLLFGSARLDYFGPGSTPTNPTTSQAWDAISNRPATNV